MKKLKLFLTALLSLIVSPVYVPAVILYEYRADIVGFYIDVFQILTFQHRLMKAKK